MKHPAWDRKIEKAAEKVVANCFVLLSVMSVVLMAVIYLFKDRLLMAFGASEAIFPYADEYLSWYLSGTAFALLATGMNQFIICQGFAKTGMKSVLFGGCEQYCAGSCFHFCI